LVGISSSTASIGKVAPPSVSSVTAVAVPASQVLAFQPVEFNRGNNVNFIVGPGLVAGSNGGAATKATLMAIARGKQGEAGIYLIVPPNSTPQEILNSLRIPNQKIV
jgi:hypothetical protein